MLSTQIWAHRGASGYAPENTLEAFKLAAEMHADGVELDVQLTKDKELVVIHDEKIDRTSNKKGFVKDYTLSELKSFNFNNGSEKYPNTKIPTLKEVYELLKPYNMKINVELKTGIFFYDGIEEKVLNLADKMGMKNRIIYSSFNHYSVMKIKKIDKNAETGLLYCDGWINIVQYAQNLQVNALHPAVYNVQYDNLIEKCKKHKIKLHVWTVNNEKEMKYFSEKKVDAVITNYPDIAVKIIKNK